MNGQPNIVWNPQPGPQKALVDCPLPEVFFGGARGGGKTDGVIGKYALKGERYGAGFNAIFFRRELPMADDAIERSHLVFGRIGWKYNAAKYTWRSEQGARLRFRPLERISDAEKYQGQNLTDACVEEAGNYPDPRPIDRLHGVLRSAGGVPTQLLLTGNPGGPGQQWIRARYIDPAPAGMRILSRNLPAGRTHRYVFIPSRLQNNRYLGDDYIDRLHLVGSNELVRAWLEGDWSAIEGAYFDCWSNARHVLRSFEIPKHWTRFRSFDWGSAAPFSVGWWAIASDDMVGPAGIVPRGAMVRYREWYGASGPGVGLKMTAEQVAEGILAREVGDDIAYGIADPSIYAQDGGPSIAERMARVGCRWRPGDNKRIPGWEQMRARMIGDGERPSLFVFDTCADFVRTVPMLQHDDIKSEDIDTESEDHAADEARYGCMSRPYTTPTVHDGPIVVVPHRPTFDELRETVAKRRDKEAY